MPDHDDCPLDGVDDRPADVEETCVIRVSGTRQSLEAIR